MGTGEHVMNFDHGLLPVTRVSRRLLRVAAGRAPWPLLVPTALLGIVAELMVLPGQPVVPDENLASELGRDAYAPVPAALLDGRRGIRRVHRAGPVEVVALSFESAQSVFANVGTLLQCTPPDTGPESPSPTLGLSSRGEDRQRLKPPLPRRRCRISHRSAHPPPPDGAADRDRRSARPPPATASRRSRRRERDR